MKGLYGLQSSVSTHSADSMHEDPIRLRCWSVDCACPDFCISTRQRPQQSPESDKTTKLEVHTKQQNIRQSTTFLIIWRYSYHRFIPFQFASDIYIFLRPYLNICAKTCTSYRRQFSDNGSELFQTFQTRYLITIWSIKINVQFKYSSNVNRWCEFHPCRSFTSILKKQQRRAFQQAGEIDQDLHQDPDKGTTANKTEGTGRDQNTNNKDLPSRTPSHRPQEADKDKIGEASPRHQKGQKTRRQSFPYNHFNPC